MGQAFGQGFDSPHLHQQVMDRSDAILFCFIWEERMARGIWIANKKREVKAFLHTKKPRQDAHG